MASRMITHTRLALGYGLAIDFHAIRLQLRGVVGSHWTAAKGACQCLLQGPRPPASGVMTTALHSRGSLRYVPYLPKVLYLTLRHASHKVPYLVLRQLSMYCSQLSS